MFYIKVAIAFALAYADWRILTMMLFKQISYENRKVCFIGTCILLAAFVIGGN